jgi:hypothetical protein
LLDLNIGGWDTMKRSLGFGGVCAALLFSTIVVGCAATSNDAGEEEATTEQAVRSVRWTVFPMADRTQNPAEKIRGSVSGHVSTNAEAVSGLRAWTVSAIDVRNLPPNRTFGAHAHALPCDNTQGGGHYAQVAGSIDPVTSEIWLDFKTDENGEASIKVISPFAVRPGGVQSIVVHANPTDPATAKAGPKLACANLAIE